MRNDKKKQQQLNTKKYYRSACVIILYHDLANFYFQRIEKMTPPDKGIPNIHKSKRTATIRIITYWTNVKSKCNSIQTCPGTQSPARLHFWCYGGSWDLAGICVFFLVLAVHYCCTQVLSLPTRKQQLQGEINGWGGRPTQLMTKRGAEPAWGRLVPLRWRGCQQWQQSGPKPVSKVVESIITWLLTAPVNTDNPLALGLTLTWIRRQEELLVLAIR